MEVENKNQQEVQELLEKLEDVACRMQLKRRILDSIRDMREDVKEPLSETAWKKKILEIDELIAYIRQSAGVEERAAVTTYGENVTEKEVMDRLSDILDKCYETNKLQNEIYKKGYRASAQEAERAMREMTNAEANFKETTHADAFCQSYRKIAARYGNQMDEAACQYVEEITDNYSTAVGKIRTMLSSLEHGSIGITKKDLYQKWEENQNGLGRKIQEDVKSLEKGGKAIADFGEHNIAELQKIVEKKEKKCKRIKRIPLYVILAVAVCMMIAGYLMKKTLTDTLEATTDGIEDIAEGSMEGQEGMLWEFGKEALSMVKESGVIDEASDKVIDTAMDTVQKALLLPAACAALIMVILWYLLVKLANNKYKKETAKAIGAYLLEQTNLFWNQEPLKAAMEESEEKIMRIAEERYKSAFAAILQGVFPNSQAESGKNGHLLKLCNEWEQMKRGI